MSKKRKRSFDEKLRLSKEKQNQDGGKSVIQDSKLKQGDDYRGKIIKDNERFQDKLQERQSKRYVSEVDEKGGQSGKRRYKLAEEKVQYQEEDQSFNYDSPEQPKTHDSNSKGFRTYDEVKDKSKPNRNVKPKTDSQVKTEESVFKSSDSRKVDSNLKSTEAKKSHLRKQAETFRKAEEFNDKASEESEPYDPLAQDTDNDGIPDRYDNNFKDSDYFESTYDVENPQRDEQINQKYNSSLTSRKEQRRKIGNDFRKHQKIEAKDLEKVRVKKKQNRKTGEDFRKAQAKKEIYQEGSKKKNFTIEGITRGKGNDGKVNTGKEAIRDREKKKRTIKEASKSGFKKESVASGILLGAERSQDLAKSYLSSGSEDNVGVEGAEKTLDTGSKLIHLKQKSLNKRKQKEAYALSRNDYKLRQKKSKLVFRDELEKTKASDEYKKSKAYKKFQKRRQMNASVQKKNNTRLRDRLKESVKELTISAKNFIARKSKTAFLVFLAVIIIGMFFINFGGTSMFLMMNTASSTLSTSYLSDQGVLSDLNQVFTSMEQELQDELSSLEDYYPGYDEYIVNKDGEIYHNTHELLAYITSRYGAIEKASDVKSALDELFKTMYQVTYQTEVEIRYRAEKKTIINENGEEETVQEQVPYEYKKLMVNLKTRSMDSVVREIFAGYPDNIIHYEALIANQGNMGDYFGSGAGDLSEIIINPDFGNPGIAFDDATTKKLFNEAEKHIGKRYVFGANGPSNFDCSSFVCWSFTHSGVRNMPRTTAYRIFTDYCNPVSPSEARAGDIIFFHGTYNSGTPISHVGIYAGNGMMIHAGDPIQYTSINTNYWKNHFYSFGRLR